MRALLISFYQQVCLPLVSRFTYEIAPVFTLMESIVLTRMFSLLGWPEGTGDGVFAPGECTGMFLVHVS